MDSAKVTKKATKKATKKVTKTATKSIEDIKTELEHPKTKVDKDIQSAVKQLKPKKVSKKACQNCGFVKPVLPKKIKERSCTICDEMCLDKKAHDDENKDKHSKIKSMIAYVKSNIDTLSLEVLQQK